LLIIILVIVIGYLSVSWVDWSFGKKPVWGATFSRIYAQYLGLDWQEAYLATLDDLKITNLRLIAYWSVSEMQDDKLTFNDLDWQVEQAQSKNVKIILALGQKAPRWPECHQPEWANALSPNQQQAKILEFLTNVITRYQKNPAIIAWQVENEPLIDFFGNCPPPNKNFLKQEIALVKLLDPTRPILVTDSGELSTWREAAGLSEILGTTLYRTVWHPWFGIVKHWQYNPLFYRLRAEMVKKFTKTQKVIIAELQAEPWGTKNRSLTQMPVSEQLKTFKLSDLKGNLEFARKTGLPEIYLWGIEWAYWLKTTQNDSTYWDLMKQTVSQ
ncbi:MAG: beta-galactosidase, partial [Candidatus Gribaldobacteria bacterium]|nr:beta-galactosidase [Candidatus Gribaldobacteria bacterium]